MVHDSCKRPMSKLYHGSCSSSLSRNSNVPNLKETTAACIDTVGCVLCGLKRKKSLQSVHSSDSDSSQVAVQLQVPSSDIESGLNLGNSKTLHPVNQELSFEEKKNTAAQVNYNGISANGSSPKDSLGSSETSNDNDVGRYEAEIVSSFSKVTGETNPYDYLDGTELKNTLVPVPVESAQPNQPPSLGLGSSFLMRLLNSNRFTAITTDASSDENSATVNSSQQNMNPVSESEKIESTSDDTRLESESTEQHEDTPTLYGYPEQKTTTTTSSNNPVFNKYCVSQKCGMEDVKYCSNGDRKPNARLNINAPAN